MPIRIRYLGERSLVSLSPQARDDLVQAVRWIAKDNPIAARALRQAVADAAERIGTHPDIGVARPNLASDTYPFLVLTGFPYVIAYNPGRKPPRIVRVLHGARDIPEVLQGG